MAESLAPLISVLLPAYNCAGTLADAVESILAQTLGDFELIVVNDGSTDGTAAVLDGLAARDARVRPLHTANGGIVQALNTALAQARGEFIARMDGDDRSHPERFARQVAYLREHPRCVCVGTLFRLMDAEGDITSVQPATGELRQTDLSVFPPHVAVLPHPSIMLRGRAVRELGGYRHGFKHAEDFDLYLRLARCGELGMVQQPLLDYRIHGGSLSSQNMEAQLDASMRAWLCALAVYRGRAEPDPAQLQFEPASLAAVLGDARLARLVLLFRTLRRVDAVQMRLGSASAIAPARRFLAGWLASLPALLASRGYWRLGLLGMKRMAKIAVGRI